MSVSCNNKLGSSNAFFFCFVREHGSKSDVAYAFDIRGGCGILRIDKDAAFRIEGDTGGGEVEAFNVGTAADSDENYVSFELEKSRTSGSSFEILMKKRTVSALPPFAGSACR